MEDKKNQITIRFNGKEKGIEHKSDKSELEAAAAKEEKEAFHWVLPEQDVSSERHDVKDVTQIKPKRPFAPKLPLHRKRKQKNRFRKKKKQLILPKKTWISVFLAIATGIIFGFIVLHLFTDPEVDSVSKSKDTETILTSTNGKAAQTLSLKVNFVQGAAFTNGGTRAVSQLKHKGFPAILTKDMEMNYMFIGVGVSEAQAKALGEIYEQTGQHTISKQWEVSSGNAEVFSKKTIAFLQEGKSMVQMLINSSAQALISDSSPFSDEAWENVVNDYGKWKKSGPQQLKEMPKSVRAEAGKLLQAIDAAVGNFSKYQNNPNKDVLWDVQQSLLSTVLHYDNIVQSTQ